MQGPTDSIEVTDWDNPKVQHSVNRAFMEMNGDWDATDDESRARLLKLVREEGFPNAELVYDPAEGKVPRVHILPEGRS